MGSILVSQAPRKFFFLVAAVVLLGSCAVGSDSMVPPTEDTTVAPAPAPAPVEVDSWDNDIAREDCALIVEQIRYLGSLYQGDSFSGSASDLNSAADVFTQVSSSYTGSDRDWLLKMAELSGSATQGSELPAKQLKANMGLVDQFCG